jgi:glutathione S-transferase
MLKLYCAPNSIAVGAVALLNEGVHWEPIRLNLKEGEQTGAAYLAVNEKGRVPTLITPEGPLTEIGAILEYLGETALPQFVPADPLHRARMRELMYYLASTMHVNHAHRFRGRRWASAQAALDDMAATVPETMTASCAYLEPRITGPYLLGPEPTLADFYLYPISTWLEGDGVDLSAFPNLVAWKAGMEARASVQKLLADGFVG